MAYFTVKIIKGNPYLYEQESCRDSQGQVHTTSKYLGRLTAAQAVGYSTKESLYETGILEEGGIARDTQKEQTTLEDLRTVAKEVRQRTAQNQQQPKKQYLPRKTTRAVAKSKSTRPLKVNLTNQQQQGKSLVTKVKLGAYPYASLSEKRLQFNMHQVWQIFSHLGVDLSQPPQIEIQYGRTLGTRKKLNGNWLITAPKEKGYGQKLRRETRQCCIQTGLELLKKQQPAKFKIIATAFKENHRQINKGLVDFVNLTTGKYRNRLKKRDAIKYSGDMSFLTKHFSKNQRNSISSYSFGLVDFKSSRRRWQDDFTQTLMAHMFGQTDLQQESFQALRRTEAALARAKKEYAAMSRLQIGPRLIAKNKVHRYQAKLQCCQALQDNIRIIQSLEQHSGQK